ncbi:MAG: hypothetical protein FJ087_12805, partial [Deltaproteobacteria bacterium]|nr:hypothetical protein [Deltaproteobacteria bacterium]
PYLAKTEKLLQSQMPENGIDEVSNGLIRNQFQDTTVAGGTPVPIPDNNPTGVSSDLSFPDLGIAEGLTVNVSLTNSDVSKVEVRLYDPQNVMYLLYSGGSTGTQITATYPVPTPTLTGDLGTWTGRNPKGKWWLEVIDFGYLNNGFDGAIKAWSVTTKTLSTKKVEVAGDLGVTGALGVAGASTFGGDVVVQGRLTVVNRPVASVWTAEEDALADGASMQMDTGIASPLLIAQAWFLQDGQWLQASTAADVQTVGTCSACGDGKHGDYVAQGNVNLAGGTYDFESFTVSPGAVVTVTGSTPLVINVQGDVVVNGSIVLSGGSGTDATSCCPDNPGGAGGGGGGAAGGTGSSNGQAGGGSGGGGQGCTAGYGSGGGGAGYSASGTAGTTSGWSCSPGGSGGAAYNDALLSQGLTGGSGGGAGGYGGAANSCGGGGGGGGGAIKMTAYKITVGSTGAILADGGRGGNVLGDRDGGAAGGGSGGTIWLRATQLLLSGNVQARGGAGGTADRSNGYGGDGGAGANGRIRVDGTVAGTSTPVFVAGDTTGLATLVRNAFPLAQPSPGVVRLTNKSGSTQKVKLVIMR